MTLSVHLRDIEVFDALPATLEDKYYVPLSANFAGIDALIKDAALQYTISPTHPIKGVQNVRQLMSLFLPRSLDLVFIVPESIATDFCAQDILTTKSHGIKQKNMPVRQFVVGVPLQVGIDTSSNKNCKLSQDWGLHWRYGEIQDK